jgi:hypothetical protein
MVNGAECCTLAALVTEQVDGIWSATQLLLLLLRRMRKDDTIQRQIIILLCTVTTG